MKLVSFILFSVTFKIIWVEFINDQCVLFYRLPWSNCGLPTITLYWGILKFGKHLHQDAKQNNWHRQSAGSQWEIPLIVLLQKLLSSVPQSCGIQARRVLNCQEEKNLSTWMAIGHPDDSMEAHCCVSGSASFGLHNELSEILYLTFDWRLIKMRAQRLSLLRDKRLMEVQVALLNQSQLQAGRLICEMLKIVE